jgi:hypothetical protein
LSVATPNIACTQERRTLLPGRESRRFFQERRKANVRGLAPLIGIVVIIALIVKFIWWILGAAAVVAVFYIARSVVREERARREAQARRRVVIAARADQQHRWVLQGDDRGIYGQYPVPDIVKALSRKEH